MTLAAAAASAADDTHTVFDFSQDADVSGWEIQDDVVMGGVSQGQFAVNEEGNAVFTGNVSLENDGGFSSLQYGFDPVDVSTYRAIHIRLKSDGKRYQLRVESEKNVRHGYAYDFETSGDWQTVEIPFADMYAIRHGDRLDLPNYPGQTLAHVQILIGNNRAESFQLEIDKLWVQ
ncbi:MAG: CIA30 family protein [Opitutae bacterium]|nr:CIA30 family protein [Opitutae bacterium]